MKKTFLKIKKWLRQIYVRYLMRKHYNRLEKTAWQHSTNYEQYLDTQLQRTLSKRDALFPERARFLIDKAASLVDLSNCDVLCIGCRNRQEIDYFQEKRAKSVIGIDLYSEDEAILVMDMHQMTFPDNSFDLIYASHSLEHSYDVQKVIAEIIRVGRSGAVTVIEVPVNYETRGADLIDFGDLASLHSAFSSHLTKILWSQEANQMVDTSQNASAKTIFVINSND